MPFLPLLLLAFLAPSSAAPAVIRLPRSGACTAPADPALYDRPVIGIVSHPGDGASGRISNGTSTSYIAASYVKFVEAGGARVIPLIYNEPEDRILEVRASTSPSYNSINLFVQNETFFYFNKSIVRLVA
jgi:gamma-glutamyl hydrolase